MNMLTARAGVDLRQVHSRSFRNAFAPAAVTGVVHTGLFARLIDRLEAFRAAAAFRHQLEMLGDTALADLGLTRAEIPAHVRRAMARRRHARRSQSPAQLSAHLLQDLDVQLDHAGTRVYTDVPLGVITRGPIARTPANVERLRRTA
ncbi:DUF1127 domain-containing protein [Rhodovibrio salinarum]|uniref:DUF1127 domain-containing protein n=1 Tax=Rhodovibrio salinarum TaxID=1087 RepID=A0A934QJB7_9PROT|nr:DUF1127 domain-containing protein [Rhodovibrio salinarum]MBK1698123.1 DUF1127 domain-containing protein [Rhodovibrio salinarum]